MMCIGNTTRRVLTHFTAGLANFYMVLLVARHLFAIAVGVVCLLAGCSKGPQAKSNPVVEVQAVNAPADEAKPLQLEESDWPQWRGPRGDGVAADREVPARWDEKTNVAWTADVPGRGHGSPIVVGSTIYLASAVTDQQKQLVIAFDRATGKRRWETVVHEGGFPDPSEIHQKGSHANGTVASDGQRVFATFFNSGRIYATALDLDGNRLWQQDVGGFNSKFGYAPSPILYKSTLIVSADNRGGGYIAALHRETGEVVWRKKRPAISTYSSPLVASIGGRDQLVISGCSQLASYNPATGEELWTCDAIAEATCGTPVTNGTEIFASGGYPERQTVCVDASGKLVWSNKTKVYEPSMVVSGEHLFAVTDDGIAWCWLAKTGKELWKQRIGGSFSASPIVCNGMIYVPNLSGETIIFKASGDAYQEVVRNRLGNDSYACIAVSGTELFMRVGIGEGSKRKERLVCLRNP